LGAPWRSTALWLDLFGLLLALVGYFGPWVPHRTAALTVTGYELAEFAKFFPQVQEHLVPVTSSLLLTPVIAGGALVGLLVHGNARRVIVRLVATGLSILLVLAAMPPYEYLQAPEYRGHLILAAVGLLFVFLSSLAGRLSRLVRPLLAAVLALMGASCALWQFRLLHPLIVRLYGQPVGLGWGLVTCVAGFALLLLSAIWDAYAASASNRR
jgi:hypothetical protein